MQSWCDFSKNCVSKLTMSAQSTYFFQNFFFWKLSQINFRKSQKISINLNNNKFLRFLHWIWKIRNSEKVLASKIVHSIDDSIDEKRNPIIDVATYYKLKLFVQKRGWREKNDLNITKDTECFEVSKIAQIDSLRSLYSVKFRCRLEIFLSFSIIYDYCFKYVIIKNRTYFCTIYNNNNKNDTMKTY